MGKTKQNKILSNQATSEQEVRVKAHRGVYGEEHLIQGQLPAPGTYLVCSRSGKEVQRPRPRKVKGDNRGLRRSQIK